MNKFSQNDICKQALLHTGDKVIEEASPDRFWGSGVKLKDAGVLDSSTWYNTGGLMSEILATVPRRIKVITHGTLLCNLDLCVFFLSCKQWMVDNTHLTP